MTRETVVVLTVLDDNPEREWWQSLGLPDPSTWSTEGLPEGAFARIVLEKTAVR